MDIGTLDLGAAFFLGLMGGAHCIGMCGGIVAALSMGRPRAWWPGVAAYQAMRIATYAALGAAVSLAGALIGSSALWSGAQRGVSVFAGAVVFFFALQLGGWLPERWGRSPFLIPSRLLKKAAAEDSLGAWGAVGFFNGLLPCGLVYAALAVALASGSAAGGAATMAAFGLGTTPWLLSVSGFMGAVGPAMRGRLLKVMALLLALYGGWMAVRPFVMHGHMKGHAAQQTDAMPGGHAGH